jgi:ELWxxDGT repeat protein
VSGSKLYFRANDGTHGEQIWSSGGSSVVPVTALSVSSPNDIADLTDVNGTLFFTYSTNGSTRVLYKLDAHGTPAIVPTGPDGGTSPGFLTNVSGTLYFSALDINGKARLFQTDGTTITLTPGDSGFNPNGLFNSNGNLFFSADDPTHGTELHAVTGGSTVTSVTASLRPSATTIDEGAKVNFDATLTGATINANIPVEWDFEGTGKFKPMGAQTSHVFTDAPKAGSYVVTARIFATDGRVFRKHVTITVKDMPDLKMKVPHTAVPGLPVPYAFTVYDSGKRSELSVDINWGDGGKPELGLPVDAGGVISGFHFYKKTNVLGFKLTVTVHDKDGTTKIASHNVSVPSIEQGVAIAGAIAGVAVGGTTHNDIIQIKLDKSGHPKSPAAEVLQFFVNGIVYSSVEADAVEIYGVAGHDAIIIDPLIRVPISVISGKSRDSIIDGGQSAIVLPHHTDIINKK